MTLRRCIDCLRGSCQPTGNEGMVTLEYPVRVLLHPS